MALHGRVSRPLPEKGLGTRLGNINVLLFPTSLSYFPFLMQTLYLLGILLLNYILLTCVHSQGMSLALLYDRNFTLDEFQLMNVNTVDVPVTVNVTR